MSNTVCQSDSKRQGITLYLSLAILSIMGLLALTLYGMVQAERTESGQRFKNNQDELLFTSATNYAFYRMKSEPKPWRTAELQYHTQEPTLTYNLNHLQNGAFAQLSIFNQDSTRHITKHTGYLIPKLPALTLLDPSTSVSLAGNAVISGGVALKNGTVSYSTSYPLGASKKARFDHILQSSSFTYFDSIAFYPLETRESFGQDFAQERCVFEGLAKIPAEVNCKTVVLRDDASCLHCKITADRLFVSHRVNLQRANVQARSIFLEDSAKVSGVYFALDTLLVSLDYEQKEVLWLVLQGKKTGPSTYIGTLKLNKLVASQILVAFLGDNWNSTFKNAPVSVAPSVNITGAILAHGSLDFRGQINGNVVAWSLVYEQDSTAWQGFLKDGKIIFSDDYKVVIPDVIKIGSEAAIAF